MGSSPAPRAGRNKSQILDEEYQEWYARPTTELHATKDKKIMKLSGHTSSGDWPVYKGASFNIWEPDTGKYYDVAEPDTVLTYLAEKRSRAGKSRRTGPYSGFSPDSQGEHDGLPPLSPRIAFRDIVSANAKRTVVCCLIPPKVFVTNTAPYFYWPRGDEKDQAYLLGVLCSIPLDWYVRCIVGLHMNFYLVNSLPVPRPDRSNPLWRRIVELAGRLACPDDRFLDWASAVGVGVGPLGEEEKRCMIFEIDAVVAHLYRLSEQQLTYIFKEFHYKWDYKIRLHEVLHYYRCWNA